MKRIKFFILIFALAISGAAKVSGQSVFELPQNIALNTKEDYTKYEPAFIEAEKWLESTDLDKETDKRKQVNAFVTQWIMGSPTVTIDLSAKLGKIYGKNPDLLVLYMAGYSRYYIENGATATKHAATKAGLISIINVYKKGIRIKTNKEMDKVIKLADENKLDDYISSELS